MESLQQIEHRAVLVFEQPHGHRDGEVGSNRYEVLVESTVVNCTQAQTVGYVRFTEDIRVADYAPRPGGEPP